MIRVALLVPSLALTACAFDTSVEGELSSGASGDADIAEPIDGASSDASVRVPDAASTSACALIGTQEQPVTHLGQINDLAVGRYYMFLGLNLFQGEVSVDERGDAWLMVLNYLHRGANNAELTVQSDGLPLLSASTLGTDESATEYWGHASPSLFSSFGAEQLRFFGVTTAHTRRIHFSTSHGGTRDYFATGSGAGAGLGEAFAPYSDHSGLLPANQNSQFQDQGDFAMTSFPFYRNGQNHWGIRGRGDRWEVDDFNSNNVPDTVHRVWVRSPSVCGNGLLEGTEQCDDGNLVAGDGCGCCVSG